MRDRQQKPELMSPAGSWPQLRAAIEAGADAVYFGLNHFSARAKVGFSVDELGSVFDLLHRHDVKGFVTFNTLVFDAELQQAEDAIAAIAQSGADAIIVQDIGVALLAKQIAPELELHGSTQMSVTTAEGVEFAAQLGCQRVVLGRELSLADIKKITAQTKVETEVFVHGALCVSYSGQCFSSEAWGGRSANRGQCAQACRLSYELFVDGRFRDTGSDRYLLSPNDLCAIDQVSELIELGVACFKIEGRYKDENYVALATQAYRAAIDAAWEKRPRDNVDETRFHLEQTYSRGLGPHFISGTDHQQVVTGRAPRHRGVKVGTVSDIRDRGFVLQQDYPIFPGDGVVVDSADWRSPDEPEEGGHVYSVTPLENDRVELRFRAGDVDANRVRSGDQVWRTSHPKLVQLIKPVAKPKSIQRSRTVDFSVAGKAGEKLRVTATSYSQVLQRKLVVHATSRDNLERATAHELDQQQLQDQLGRLGTTPFQLGKVDLELDRSLFLPVSQINEIRRSLIDKLLAAGRRKEIEHRSGIVAQWFDDRPNPVKSTTRTKIHVLVRNQEQLEAALQSKSDSITLDYLDLYGLRPAVESIRSAGLLPRVASPRILKPAEQNVIRFLLSLDCPIVVRSGGLLAELLKIASHERPPLIGDFSLNAANVVSTQLLLDLGVDRVTPTYDLNGQQITDLTRWIPTDKLEVIAYSHLPVFHTEHCVFCRFLSTGTDNTNCGHPCEKHRVQLQDQKGRMHPVMADVGCRNTVFGAEAQSSADYFSQWLAAGLQDFRLEFVQESADQVATITDTFLRRDDRLMKGGRIDTQRFQSAIKNAAPAGISVGSLYTPKR